MTTVADIAAQLDAIAPPKLAEDWDNTGLLIGDPTATVTRGMTCLTVTPASAAEAVERGVQLVISHHPLPFRGVKQIATTTHDGGLVWQLATAGISLLSPHTRFDSAAEGINRQLADRLGLLDAVPLVPIQDDPTIGSGRVATPAEPLTAGDLCRQINTTFSPSLVRLVGDEQQPATRIGFACGSGGALLEAAIHAGCDALLTGEATFHTCLAAEAAGVALVLMGHYHSERFAVEWLAERLGKDFPEVEFWPSQQEQDPLHVVSG